MNIHSPSRWWSRSRRLTVEHADGLPGGCLPGTLAGITDRRSVPRRRRRHRRWPPSADPPYPIDPEHRSRTARSVNPWCVGAQAEQMRGLMSPSSKRLEVSQWIPAFAGMTRGGGLGVCRHSRESTPRSGSLPPLSHREPASRHHALRCVQPWAHRDLANDKSTSNRKPHTSGSPSAAGQEILARVHHAQVATELL